MNQSPPIDRVHLLSALRSLDDWVTGERWIGYDPYDVKGTPLGLKAVELQRRYRIPSGRLLNLLSERIPFFLRRVLRVRPMANAKGHALFASAYVMLQRELPERGYDDKALRLLDWLLQSATERYGGIAWGYPFDWRSRVLIPAGTPSAVVTSVVGDAFWRAYRLFGRDQYLHVCRKVCDFFLHGLNVDRIGQNVVCFSYTPLDHFHVHNANLMVAEFLIRVGTELGHEDLQEVGRCAVEYALAEQNEDGSIFYWGRVDRSSSSGHIDNYHSGFEIRALNRIAAVTGEARYRDAAVKYFTFYRENLLEEEGGRILPRSSPSSRYPIDVHACAESILCTVEMRYLQDPPMELTRKLTSWVIEMMQDLDGWFIYKLRKGLFGERRVAFPYMRWGQAWMLLALSEALVHWGESRGPELMSDVSD